MRIKAYFILLLMLAVIAAPVVDATVCDGCKDIIQLRDRSQSVAKGDDHPECLESASDACASDSQGAALPQDLCPVCANSAVALNSLFCDAPYATGYTYPHPTLLAFADPSDSITKPPEN